MSKIWFGSDPHFSHRNIHRFCPKTRPDADIETMNRKMIARWQEQVAPEDTVFLLGDIFFCNLVDAKAIMNQLPGEIHLIYGNHDDVIKESVHLQSMFASVQDYKELSLPNGRWVLFHFPMQEWHKINKGSYHLHGHIHERLSGVDGRIANVCLDSPTFGTGDYSLYSMDQVKRYLDKQPIREFPSKRL